MSAAAMTSSPSTVPHSSKPLLEVRMVEARPWRRLITWRKSAASVWLTGRRPVSSTTSSEGWVSTASRFGLLERADEVGQRAEVHPATALCGAHGESDREVRLAHAGRPGQDDVLLALEETELGSDPEPVRGSRPHFGGCRRQDGHEVKRAPRKLLRAQHATQGVGGDPRAGSSNAARNRPAACRA